MFIYNNIKQFLIPIILTGCCIFNMSMESWGQSTIENANFEDSWYVKKCGSSSYRSIASPFTTPAGSNIKITKVQVYVYDATYYSGFQVYARIETNNSGSPSNTIVTNGTSNGVIPSANNSWVDITYSTGSEPVLSPSTTYFLVIAGTTGSSNSYCNFRTNNDLGDISKWSTTTNCGSESWSACGAKGDICYKIFYEVLQPTVSFYNTGSSSQLAFNNSYIFDNTPTFRVSGTHTSSFNRFQVEINTASDFSGTAYTQTFSGTYSSGTQYDLECNSLSSSLPTTNGVTYYVRVKASDDGGSSYGPWSSETYSFTYKSSGEVDWMQTTTAQFGTASLTMLQATSNYIYMPVTSSTFYGETTSTGSNENGDDYIIIQKINATSSFQLASLSVYFRSLGSTNKFVLALYDDDGTAGAPGTRLAYTSEQTASSTGWKTVVPTSTPTLSAGYYYIAYTSDDYYLKINYIGTGGIGGGYTSRTYDGTLPSSCPSITSGSYTYAMYLTTAVPTGEALSPSICFSSYIGASAWDQVTWSETETNGNVKLQVWYDNSGTPTIIGDGIISGNSSGIASSPIDISGLNTTTYAKLYLKAILTPSGGSPLLNDWKVTCSFSQPLITVGSLSAFSDQCINTTSANKTYTVSGSNLTDNITITPPAGYEISTSSGSGFVNNSSYLTLTQSGGTVNSTTIYVRFKPTAEQTYSGNITHTSSGATQKNVAVTGDGVDTEPTVTAGSAGSITSSSATISGNTITDIGCSTISAYGVEYSTTENFTPGTGIQQAGSGFSGSSGGSFSAGLSSLSSNTTYYYRAYATNNGDTDYSDQSSFTTLLPECSGTPNPGNTQATETEVCPGGQTTLSFQNSFTSYSGITYQWQSSTNGTDWSNINGATSTTYVATVTDNTYYRCNVICSYGGTGSSTALEIEIGMEADCYCAPTYSNGGSTDNVTGVVLQSLNDTPPANNSPYYFDRTSVQNAIPQIYQSYSYNVSITMGSGSPQYSRVWIDFDQDGTFETGESFSLGTDAGANGTSVIPITVPLGAVPGVTILRIRGGDDSAISNNQPCGASNSTWGQALDYYVNIIELEACDNIPNPGNTLSTATEVCSGENFTLSLQYGFPFSGITYQWQYSTNGTDWSNIGGATNTTYQTSITSDTYFRCAVTCSGEGIGYSSSLLIDASMMISCYCESYGAGTLPGIKYVGFGDISNVSGVANYSDFTYLMATVTPNESYNIDVKVNTDGSRTYHIFAWIDWNHDGDFADSGEAYDLGTAYNVSNGSASACPYSITVPSGAVLGNTYMRVSSRYNTDPTPCSTGYDGEVEDYSIRVVAPVACSGVPEAGTVYPSYQFVESGSTAILSVPDYDYNEDITFQWQSSDSPDGPWSNVSGGSGATTPFYTTPAIYESTYYRLKTTCNNAKAAIYSPVGKVDLVYLISGSSPITSCSGAFFDSGGGGPDQRGNSTYYYANNGDYTMVFQPNTAYSSIKIYFDYFKTEEDADIMYVYNGNSTNEADLLGQYSGELEPFIVCSSDPSGILTVRFDADGLIRDDGWEARFECVPPCTGTPDGGSVNLSMDQGCSGINTTIYFYGVGYDVNGMEYSGYSYQWQVSTDGTAWSDISGQTNPAVGQYITSISRYFRLKVTCIGSSESAYSSSAHYVAHTCDTYEMGDSGSPIETCAAMFYDSGGPSGNYSNSESQTITFCTDGSSEHVKIIFFNIDIDFTGDTDYLYVFDGDSDASTLIFQFTGTSDITNIPPEIVSSGECITFKFISGGSTTDTGWEAVVICTDDENTTAHNFCDGATHICNLNGYRGTTSGFYQPNFPGNFQESSSMFGGTIENNSWIAFTAESTSAEFNVSVSNCNGGSNAIQLGVYQATNCDGFVLVSSDYYTSTSATLANNTTTTISVPAYGSGISALVPGNTYYIMIDGNAGAICDYQITAESGIEYASVDITEDCIDDGGHTTVTASGGEIYSWTGPGSFSASTASVTIYNVGTYTVTIASGNPLCPDEVEIDVVITRCSTLPIELSEFNAYCNRGYAVIEWTTESEINNDYFILEKSEDMMDFVSIAKIKGKGNSNVSNKYFYNDYNLSSGNVYYRLKQVDFDGQSEISHAINLDCSKMMDDNTEIYVYPNPFNSELNIYLSDFSNEKVYFEIYDELGKFVISENVIILENTYEHKLYLGDLRPAVYYLRIITGNNVVNRKIVKQ